MTKLEELRESVEDTLRTSSAAYDVWLEASFENLEIDTYTELCLVSSYDNLEKEEKSQFKYLFVNNIQVGKK